MFSDDELVMLSALTQYAYCRRRCALIHVEHVFEENVYTVRGRMVHEQVDESVARTDGSVRVETALPLWSERLGLVGKADVVEFFEDGTPYPVEYKHGARRKKRHDDLQLCAQAICLEEMLDRAVPRGAVFHHKSRRRREVEFTDELRSDVEKTVVAVRELLLSGELPSPAADARCPNCSLIDLCMPEAVQRTGLRRGEQRLFVVDDRSWEFD